MSRQGVRPANINQIYWHISKSANSVKLGWSDFSSDLMWNRHDLLYECVFRRQMFVCFLLFFFSTSSGLGKTGKSWTWKRTGTAKWAYQTRETGTTCTQIWSQGSYERNLAEWKSTSSFSGASFRNCLCDLNDSKYLKDTVLAKRMFFLLCHLFYWIYVYLYVLYVCVNVFLEYILLSCL